MSGQKFAEDYVDVATRIVLFREKHPDGSLQPFDPAEPVKLVTVGDRTHLQYVACAYRSPDDSRPGIGVAWEPFPGTTPFTRGSEAMVAETSAWGRAIVAAMAADTKTGVASADEVRVAQARRTDPPVEPPAEPPPSPAEQARVDLAVFCSGKDMDLRQVADDFLKAFGNSIQEASFDQLEEFTAGLKERTT